jgi:ornithine cyclodeaminase/alanine dehydrogenase-like protein (mu-crystallin family)
MDADWLTAQRTAATAAIAADVLANPSIAMAGVLGSSDQARAMLAAVARVRKLSQIKVFSPTEANRMRFADQMSEQLGSSVYAVHSAREAVLDCDLVISVYRAGTEPLISADWLKEGVHLNAGSSIRPEARELKDNVWERCSVVAVDDRAHVFESGDGRSAIASKLIPEDRPVELWELIGNTKSGRGSSNDITLFKGVGTALQDLALATAIFRKAVRQGLGQDIGSFPRARR